MGTFVSTHGLHNTIQVRSIGTNGVVIARSNHHGGLNTKEEVGYGTTVSVNVDDHIWLYKEYDSLRKNHSKYKHEFIVNRVERENTIGWQKGGSYDKRYS